jgi:hypothetical protein
MTKATQEAKQRARKAGLEKFARARVEELLKFDETLKDKFWVEELTEVGDFGFYTVVLYRLVPGPVSFKILDALSALFDTKMIDVNAVNRQTGCCEICADSETIAQVTLYEAVF